MHARLVALALAGLVLVAALPALAQPLPPSARATRRCS